MISQTIDLLWSKELYKWKLICVCHMFMMYTCNSLMRPNPYPLHVLINTTTGRVPIIVLPKRTNKRKHFFLNCALLVLFVNILLNISIN